jgi:hypothetical protein
MPTVSAASKSPLRSTKLPGNRKFRKVEEAFASAEGLLNGSSSEGWSEYTNLRILSWKLFPVLYGLIIGEILF